MSTFIHELAGGLWQAAMSTGLSEVADAMISMNKTAKDLISETQISFLTNETAIREQLHSKRVGIDGPPHIAIPAMQEIFGSFIQVPA